MSTPETDVQWALRFAAMLCDNDPAYDALFIRMHDEAMRSSTDDAVRRQYDRLIHRNQIEMA